MARKPKYQRGEIMCDTEQMILVKGNLTVEEFNAAVNGDGTQYDYTAEQIKHGWRRCQPARNICEDYDFLLAKTEPHARGAFEATWVEW